MDGSHFDTLARAIAQSGTRRRLVSLLLALPLGGVLAIVGEEEVAAERPLDRVQRRTPQRNRKQRNNNKNNNQEQPAGARTAATAPRTRTRAAAPRTAGGRACCRAPAANRRPTSATRSGLCCAPNCAGRQCGPDGCGKAGPVAPVGSARPAPPRARVSRCPTGPSAAPPPTAAPRCAVAMAPAPIRLASPVGWTTRGCPGPCGGNGQNCCLANVAIRAFASTITIRCLVLRHSGMPAAAISSARVVPKNASACICGTCQVPPS